jgi:RHS repeat-associated protein
MLQIQCRRGVAGLLAAALALSLPLGALAQSGTETDTDTTLDGADEVYVLSGAQGEAAAFGLDSANGLVWVQTATDTADTRTQYTYDAQKHLVEIKKAVSGLTDDASEIKTTYTYEGDAVVGVQHSNTAQNATTYTLAYDEDGQLTQADVGERTLVSYRYTDNGEEQTVQTTYGNGDTCLTTYDAQGRVVSVLWNEDASGQSYLYDDSGLKSGVLNTDNTAEQWTRDAAGRLVLAQEKSGDTVHRVEWTYDANGRLVSITETTENTSDSQTADEADPILTAFTYDSAGRVARVTQGSTAAVYAYSADGQTQSCDLWYEDVPVAAIETNYNDAAQVEMLALQTASGASELFYTYDTDGRLVKIESTAEGDAWTVSYEYDSAGQLVRENNSAAGKTWVWRYDAGGNLRQKSEYAYTEEASPLSAAALRTVAYIYGESGWGDLLLACDGQTLQTDAIGNLLDDGTWTYNWQHGRQLAAMSNSAQALTFGYNAAGLRTSKTVNGVTWQYTYADDALTGMTNGTDTLRFGYNAEGVCFVEYNGSTYFYLTDWQGNVLGLTDAAGNLVVEYSYDAWGAPLGVTGTLADTLGALNPLRYRGYFYDTETGLYYLGSRYYSPTLGRFISADEQIATSGSALLGGNLFAYGFNDPVNTIDPDGTWPRQITAALTVLSGAWALKTRTWRATLTTLVSAATYELQVLHYDLRKALNVDLPDTREEALAEGWLGPDTDPEGPPSLLHQFTAAVFGSNTKYVSPDGTREAIYDEDGQLVTDQRDVGTYNFVPAGTWLGNIVHTVVDMFPWVIFGNGDADPGPLLDTVLMLFK